MATRGPNTGRGKAAVRRNAIKHGLGAGGPIVTAHESTADRHRHRDGTVESLKVEGHLKTEPAERAALLLWRLKRVARYETDTTNQYAMIGTPSPDGFRCLLPQTLVGPF